REIHGMRCRYVPFSPAGSSPSRLSSAAMYRADRSPPRRPVSRPSIESSAMMYVRVRTSSAVISAVVGRGVWVRGRSGEAGPGICAAALVAVNAIEKAASGRRIMRELNELDEESKESTSIRERLNILAKRFTGSGQCALGRSRLAVSRVLQLWPTMDVDSVSLF